MSGHAGGPGKEGPGGGKLCPSKCSLLSSAWRTLVALITRVVRASATVILRVGMFCSGPGLAGIVTCIVHIIEIDALLVPRGHSGLWQVGSSYRSHASLVSMVSGGRPLDARAALAHNDETTKAVATNTQSMINSRVRKVDAVLLAHRLQPIFVPPPGAVPYTLAPRAAYLVLAWSRTCSTFAFGGARLSEPAAGAAPSDAERAARCPQLPVHCVHGVRRSKTRGTVRMPQVRRRAARARARAPCPWRPARCA